MGKDVGVRVQLGALDPVPESRTFEVVCIRPGKANGVEFSEGVLQVGPPLVLVDADDHGPGVVVQLQDGALRRPGNNPQAPHLAKGWVQHEQVGEEPGY